MKKAGYHLICGVKHNTFANLPLPPIEKRGRGRPKLKGDKVKLSSLFEKSANSFTVLDDKRYLCIDLYWSPAGRVVRFVLVESPKVRAILMSTDTSISPETIIKAYEARWMIETGFKTAMHQLGSFSYRFWMKAMKKTKYGQLKQYIHRESEEYRAMIQRKMHSYHTYMAFGCICQGLLIHLALNYRHAVWASFSGWLRTIRPDLEPSELLVANALKSTLPNFLLARNSSCEWLKFYKKQLDTDRQPMLARSA